MANSKNLKLTDLLVNTENYRFESVASQKEAIDLMVDEQGDKLFNLAEHIVKHGLNPNDKIQVVVSNHDSKKFNVVEGNRRVVTIKLLTNPDLIDDKSNASLRKKFHKLHDEYASKIPHLIECTVYDSPADADVWIKLKHGGQSNGAGTVDWNAQQIQRFEEKVEGKSSIALQTINLLKNSEDVPDDIKKSLNKIPVTNLDRLLSDPGVRNMLGIDISNGIIQSSSSQKEVVKGLTKVAKDLLDPSFSVKKIYTKDDRKDYVKKFPKTSLPNTTKKVKPWTFNNPTSSNAKPSAGSPKRVAKERKVLIPRNCVLSINNTKVNSIYHELQKLDLTKFTNATAVLFRVFVELSVDSYIEHHKLTTAPSSAKSGTSFQNKVFQVANHLTSKNLADATICHGIKTTIKDGNDVLGLETWHAYVHNNRFSPKADVLRLTWDNVQDFMTALWNNIK